MGGSGRGGSERRREETRPDENQSDTYMLAETTRRCGGNCHSSVTIVSRDHVQVRVTLLLPSWYVPIFSFWPTPTRFTTQEPSLRLVPPAEHKSASLTATANSLGLHDTLRYGLRSIAAETKTRDDTEHRLSRVSTCFLFCFVSFNEPAQWEETQDNLKMSMLRNLYGVHAPARLLMERKIVAAVSSRDHNAICMLKCSQNPHMPGMGRSNVHLDILMGRDETLDPQDFFLGRSVILACSGDANMLQEWSRAFP